MTPLERLQQENEALHRQLREAEEALRAIGEGQVDAIVVDGQQGPQIFSLAGAERIYRVLVETMSEAALAMAPDGTILFCNQGFCELMRTPMADALGRTLQAFTPDEERVALEAFLADALTGRVHRQFVLLASGGTVVPVHLAASPLESGENASICVVASDLTRLEASAKAIKVLQAHERAMERAEVALLQSEEKLRLAQVSAGAGMWTWEIPADTLEWSRQLFELFGLDPEKAEANFESWRAALHPDDRRAADEGIQRAIATRSPLAQEYRVVHPGGEVRWISALGDTVYDDDGKPLRMSGICIDITARKQTEADLADSRQRYRDLLETTSDFIWETDATGHYTYCSPHMETLWGLKPAEMIGRMPFDVMLPEDRVRATQLFAELAQSGRPFTNLESQAVAAGGRLIHVETNGVPFFDGDGRLLGFRGISRDVTARKVAEEELRRSETAYRVAQGTQAERQRFLDVLETLPAMICLLKPDYHVAFANRAFRNEFGEARGRRCYEYCFGKDAPCEFCQSFEVLKTGRPHHWEVTTPSGTVIEANDFPFNDADGSPMILEMDVDITQWRRTEKELQDANEVLAERALQLRALAGELTLSEQRERRRLAGILHDHLQQLLVAAKYRTAALAQVGDEPSAAAAAEVEQLLDTSIAAARTLTAELSPPILQEAGLRASLQWLVRWMADRHGLQVNLAIDEDTPLIVEDVRVLLFESVRELLFNVVKHAKVGSAEVTMRRTADAHLRITVSDAGRGFDPATLRRAGDSGQGFGLFGIRERLELLGGCVDIESSVGGGSRFTLTAPLARVAVPPPPAIAAPPSAGGTAVGPRRQTRAGPTIRVLIADDHAVVREGLRRLLSHEHGLQIVGEAVDGQQVIELAGALLPDVILMDASMPRLDGVEATRVIHRDYPGIRIIGLSMFEDLGHSEAMRTAGAVEYLAKSGPPRDLLSAIRRAGTRRLSRSQKSAPRENAGP